MKAAIGYIQTELRNPADFGQFAIGTEIVDKGSSSKETYVLSLDGMISKASMALSPEDPMYGLAEYFQDNPNLLDQTLLTRNDDALKKMMKTAFLSEQVMPGQLQMVTLFQELQVFQRRQIKQVHTRLLLH